MKFPLKKTIALATALITFNASACTFFQIVTTNGKVINSRSMEWAIDTKTWQSMPARFVIRPAKTSITIDSVAKTTSLAYAGIETYDNLLTEGVNEKGLSISALWYKTGKNPTRSESKDNIANTEVMPWILGNFSSAKDAIAALNNKNVYAPFVKTFNQKLPIHYILTDVNGDYYVIEFDDGKMTITDQKDNKVTTNEPSIQEQRANLATFYAKNKNLLDKNQAGEMSALPGGYSPKDRFVKISVIKNLLPKTGDTTTAVYQSFNLLNNVDYPRGVPSYNDGSRGASETQETSWTSVINLTDKKYYIRSNENLNIQEIDITPELFTKTVSFDIYKGEKFIIKNVK
ncbi:TPA: linear amide C-N hydrolase [Serratia marcescens]|nr:linear amide C-N hydrolase [Serratia marcescens]